MAKPNREVGTSSSWSGNKSGLDNPARAQDVQALHKDKSFYLTKGGVMTPVALHAQGTIKPAPLHDRGYNKEPGQDTLPTGAQPNPASGAIAAAFGLKGGK